MKRRSKGFSLVELIVVLTIMAIVAAVCTPSISSYVHAAKVQNYQTALNNLIDEVQTQLPQNRYWNWEEVQKNAEAILRSEAGRGVTYDATENEFIVTNASSDSNAVFRIKMTYHEDADGTSQLVTLEGSCDGYSTVKTEASNCTVTLKANYMDVNAYPQALVSTITTTNKGGWKSLDDFARPRSEWETILNPANPDYAVDWSEFDFLVDTLVGGSDSDMILNTTEYPADSISAVRFTMNLYTTKSLINGNHYVAWPSIQVQDGQGTGGQYSACGVAGFDNLYVYIGSDNDYDNADNWVAWNETFYEGAVNGQGCFVLRTVTGDGIYPADANAGNYSTLTDEAKAFYDKYLSSGVVSPKVEYKVNLIDPNGLQNSRGWISLLCGNDPQAWADGDSGTAGAGTYPENPYLFLDRADASNKKPDVYVEDGNGVNHTSKTGIYLDKTNLSDNGDGTYTDVTNGAIVTFDESTGNSSVSINLPTQENAGNYASPVLSDENGYYIPYYETGDRVITYINGLATVTINLPEKSGGYYGNSVNKDSNGDSYISYIQNTATDSHGNLLSYQNGTVKVEVNVPTYNDNGWYGGKNDIIYEDGCYKIPYYTGWQIVDHWLDLSSYVDDAVMQSLSNASYYNGVLFLEYLTDTNPCEERVYLRDFDAVYDENQTENIYTWNNTLEIKFQSDVDPRPMKKVYLKEDLDVDYAANHTLNTVDNTLQLYYYDVNRYVKNYTKGEFYLDLSKTGYLVNDRLKITFTNVNADEFIDSFELMMQVTGTFRTNGSFLGGIDRSNYTIQPGSDPNTVDVLIDMMWDYYPYFYVSYDGGLSGADVGVECSVTWVSETTSTENVEVSTSIPMLTINGDESYTNVTLDWSKCDLSAIQTYASGLQVHFSENISYVLYNNGYQRISYVPKQTFSLSDLHYQPNYSTLLANGVVHFYCDGVSVNDIQVDIVLSSELQNALSPEITTPVTTTATTVSTVTTTTAALTSATTTTVESTTTTTSTSASMTTTESIAATSTSTSTTTTESIAATSTSIMTTESTAILTSTSITTTESIVTTLTSTSAGDGSEVVLDDVSFGQNITIPEGAVSVRLNVSNPSAAAGEMMNIGLWDPWTYYANISYDDFQNGSYTIDFAGNAFTGMNIGYYNGKLVLDSVVFSFAAQAVTTTSTTIDDGNLGGNSDFVELEFAQNDAYNENKNRTVEINGDVQSIVMHIDHSDYQWEYAKIYIDNDNYVKAGWNGNNGFIIEDYSSKYTNIKAEIDQSGNLTIKFLDGYQPPSTITVSTESDSTRGVQITINYANQTFSILKRQKPIAALFTAKAAESTTTTATTTTTTTTITTTTTTEATSSEIPSVTTYAVGLDEASAAYCKLERVSGDGTSGSTYQFKVVPKSGYTLGKITVTANGFPCWGGGDTWNLTIPGADCVIHVDGVVQAADEQTTAPVVTTSKTTTTETTTAKATTATTKATTKATTAKSATTAARTTLTTTTQMETTTSAASTAVTYAVGLDEESAKFCKIEHVSGDGTKGSTYQFRIVPKNGYEIADVSVKANGFACWTSNGGVWNLTIPGADCVIHVDGNITVVTTETTVTTTTTTTTTVTVTSTTTVAAVVSTKPQADNAPKTVAAALDQLSDRNTLFGMLLQSMNSTALPTSATETTTTTTTTAAALLGLEPKTKTIQDFSFDTPYDISEFIYKKEDEELLPTRIEFKLMQAAENTGYWFNCYVDGRYSADSKKGDGTWLSFTDVNSSGDPQMSKDVAVRNNDDGTVTVTCNFSREALEMLDSMECASLRFTNYWDAWNWNQISIDSVTFLYDEISVE